MQLKKTAILLAVSALTACAATTKPLATPIIKVVEQPVLPPVSSELLVTHERPERPAGGSPEQLLNHAVRYGAYCQKLEAQVSGWRAWYQREKQQQ